MFLQHEREQEILGHAVGRKAADLAQRVKADDRRGAAAERDPPGIARGLDLVEKEPLFVGVGPAEAKVVLDRVGVEEMLRRLHQPDLGVVKQRQRPLDKALVRHEIGVQDRHEIGGRFALGQAAQGVVDVAGLGADVAIAAHVIHAAGRAVIAQPVAFAVIENMDRLVGMAQRAGADDGAFQHLEAFVVGGDQDRDPRAARRAIGRVAPPLPVLFDLGTAVEGARHHQEGTQRPDHRQPLDEEERPACQRVHRKLKRRDGVGHPPEHVAQRQKGADAEQHHPMRCPVGVCPVGDQKTQPQKDRGEDQGRCDIPEEQHRGAVSAAGRAASRVAGVQRRRAPSVRWRTQARGAAQGRGCSPERRRVPDAAD